MAKKIEHLSLSETWEKIIEDLNEKNEPFADLNLVYQFNLSGEEEGVYQLVLKEGIAAFNEGTKNEPDVTLSMKLSDFQKLLIGKLNSTAAYMMGKLKVKGNIGLALKLESLLKQYDFSGE